jgi:hypothetical protein
MSYISARAEKTTKRLTKNAESGIKPQGVIGGQAGDTVYTGAVSQAVPCQRTTHHGWYFFEQDTIHRVHLTEPAPTCTTHHCSHTPAAATIF